VKRGPEPRTKTGFGAFLPGNIHWSSSSFIIIFILQITTVQTKIIQYNWKAALQRSKMLTDWAPVLTNQDPQPSSTTYSKKQTEKITIKGNDKK